MANTLTKPVFGIVADDFTGAMLVASFFEDAGLASPVYFDPVIAESDKSAAPVIVVAVGTRLVTAENARGDISAALDALDALGCETVAYKACSSFDSTPEGNIGTAAELLADRYQQDPLLLSAGFPKYRTTVYNGFLFSQGTLVTESNKRFDPVTPMPDPNLVRFLSLQSETPLGLVSHHDLIGGHVAAKNAVQREREKGHKFILLDCADDDDTAINVLLARDVRAFVASDAMIIAVGIDQARNRTNYMAPPRHVSGPGAVLVGSVGPAAEAQLAHFHTSHPVLTLDLLSELTEDELVEKGIDWALPHIGKRPFAITTFADGAGIARAQEKHGRLGAARLAERLLARVSTGLRTAGVRRFVIAGGETSGAVVRALGVRQVRAFPSNSAGGGFCVAEKEGLSFFLKSGKIGSDDVLSRALSEMDAE